MQAEGAAFIWKVASFKVKGRRQGTWSQIMHSESFCMEGAYVMSTKILLAEVSLLVNLKVIGVGRQTVPISECGKGREGINHHEQIMNPPHLVTCVWCVGLQLISHAIYLTTHNNLGIINSRGEERISNLLSIYWEIGRIF